MKKIILDKNVLKIYKEIYKENKKNQEMDLNYIQAKNNYIYFTNGKIVIRFYNLIENIEDGFYRIKSIDKNSIMIEKEKQDMPDIEKVGLHKENADELLTRAYNINDIIISSRKVKDYIINFKYLKLIENMVRNIKFLGYINVKPCFKIIFNNFELYILGYVTNI